MILWLDAPGAWSIFEERGCENNKKQPNQKKMGSRPDLLARETEISTWNVQYNFRPASAFSSVSCHYDQFCWRQHSANLPTTDYWSRRKKKEENANAMNLNRRDQAEHWYQNSPIEWEYGKSSTAPTLSQNTESLVKILFWFNILHRAVQDSISSIQFLKQVQICMHIENITNNSICVDIT